MRSCEKKFITEIETTIKTNTKAFFAYTKSLNKSNKLPNLMKLNSESSDDPNIIADFFAKHFESIYDPVDTSID